MRVAVLSDIHSNRFALAAVVEELKAEPPDQIIVLGDTFGYYPWAAMTYDIVQDLHPIALLGNHDKLVLDASPPEPAPIYWDLAKQNERELATAAPDALQWLRGLVPSRELEVGGRRIMCCHGTPSDPLNGRHYPDNPNDPPSPPGKCEILLMGHTHYPFVRTTEDGRLLVNPGSVGQPRDGDLRASWGWLYPHERRFELHRTKYDVARAVELLTRMGWCRLAIEALRKDYRGRLQVE